MIKDILEKSQQEKRIIGVWVYGDDNGFWSGYVKELTEEFVIFQHFTKYGEPDGLVIEKLESIQSIDFNDDYTNVMQYLIDRNSIKIEEINVEIQHAHAWQTDVLEPFIGKKNRIVQIQVNRDSFYSGFVEWVDHENLILRIVGTNGEDKGKSFFRIEDINGIRVNNKNNRRKMTLYKWRERKQKSDIPV